MILRRIGRKSKLAPKIISYFPRHDCYLEPFWGTGAIFFAKPLVKYNYVNDIDNDVFNLFMQVTLNWKALYEAIEKIPYHKAAWQWLRTLQPDNDLYRAVKFCILSNYSYLGKGQTLYYSLDNNKSILLSNIEKTYNFLCKGEIKFNNVDFRKFIKEFAFKNRNEKSKAFCYCDPPYVGTDDNYSHSFTAQDFIDLLDVMQESDLRFAISEFNTELVQNEAEKRKLNVIPICERQTLKSRNVEILLTNYKTNNTLF